jgi:acetyl esterase/lipase
LKIIIAGLLWLVSGFAVAEVLTVNVGNLMAVRQTVEGVQNSVDRALAGKIQLALNKAALHFGADGLHFSRHEEGISLGDSCSFRGELETLDTTIVVSPESSFSWQLDSLNKPMRFAMNVRAAVESHGRVQQEFGTRVFGRCVRTPDDHFRVNIIGQMVMAVDIELIPNLTVESGMLRFRPEFSVDVRIRQAPYAVDVDGTVLAGITQSAIEDKLDEYLGPQAETFLAESLASSLHQAVIDSWGDASLLIELEQLDTRSQAALGAFLDRPLLGPASREYLDNNLARLTLALVQMGDDSDLLSTFVYGMLACEGADDLMLDLPAYPLFERIGEQCSAIDPAGIAAPGTYFADSQCTRAISFTPFTHARYCKETLDPQRLGNGALLQSSLPAWSLAPGTRLDFSVEDISQNHQPFLTRAVYKRVSSAAGECALEMRVYKESLATTGLKPLLALHGGSWTHRQTGFVMLESEISQYTAQGYVVFVPFYRLTADKDGPDACRHATGSDILEDVSDALAWVKAEAAAYGASGGIYTMGQSAGAYLAAWLAVHRSADISRALLLYPPTDFSRLVAQAQAGVLSEEVSQGIGALEHFIGRTLAESHPDDADIVALSLSRTIQDNKSSGSPMFVIHGARDKVVPVDQSIRLCSSLGGSADLQGGTRFEKGVVTRFSCGSKSRLHVIHQGDHALDACLFSLYCPAGDQPSRDATASSLVAARKWFGTPLTKVAAESATRAAGTSGGGALGFMMLPLVWCGWYLVGWRRSSGPLLESVAQPRCLAQAIDSSSE